MVTLFSLFKSMDAQLVFYMTQMVHDRFFTMTEIGRITMPEALSCLHSSITPKAPPYLIGIAVTKPSHPHLSLHLSAHPPPIDAYPTSTLTFSYDCYSQYK
ncbi:hypothetical protein RO3G_07182 [Rhizopus delemar RA 99-880]|uniref:Uncharacterized protein n=1 Tax=Rhizopus delemar (strain RA 99-880 / ATCC MYA-4621 / FGSC 9543 / NRRL 43880) TaxID=246409 RepID=I1C1Z7_RHIO9|nr:hypothetical protein RO3G_07182 [Rhizopus delemar RA 99-880]|eukprot:EIE82477.1 hypothetical protein RO3G_07182 [Rhizopus delemar RA 99-880]